MISDHYLLAIAGQTDRASQTADTLVIPTVKIRQFFVCSLNYTTQLLFLGEVAPETGGGDQRRRVRRMRVLWSSGGIKT